LKLIGLKTAGSLKRVGLCIVSYKIFPHQWWSLNPTESLLRVDRYTGYIRYTGICSDTGLAILTI
jgi:hypothetical protein